MGIEHLPRTLGEAIDVMAGSEVVEKALGSHVSRATSTQARGWQDYRVQVTPWELERYLAVT